MLGKAQAKLIKMLQQKKQRKKQGLFVVEGDKMVREALVSTFVLRNAYATENWIEKSGLKPHILKFFTRADQSILDKASFLNTPPEVLAVLEIPKHKMQIDPGKELILALDQIQDPGNLGTIIRIADWFGISDIVCSKDCVDAFNPKVVQSSMGSIFRVKIHNLDLKYWLDNQYCTIYGAVLQGRNLWEGNLQASGILLMGNESSGVSEELIKLIDQPLTIPAFGKAESLNVAVATGIFCAEFAKIKKQD